MGLVQGRLERIALRPVLERPRWMRVGRIGACRRTPGTERFARCVAAGPKSWRLRRGAQDGVCKRGDI